MPFKSSIFSTLNINFLFYVFIKTDNSILKSNEKKKKSKLCDIFKKIFIDVRKIIQKLNYFKHIKISIESNNSIHDFKERKINQGAI